MPSRSPFRRRVVAAAVAAALVLFAGVDAFLVEPYWIEVTRHHVDAPIARLTIAHLSDLHLADVGRRERSTLALLRREKPDLIVVTGDLVGADGRFEPVAEVLRDMSAPLGVWIVRGNWDGWGRDDIASEALSSRGIRLLTNEGAAVRPDVYLVGLDDDLLGARLLDTAFAGAPSSAYRIALFHRPVRLSDVSERADLALAGHTHGGQVRFPVVGPLWLPPGSNGYTAGWYEAGRARMYVSRGIGTTFLRVRFLCRPELAMITVGR